MPRWLNITLHGLVIAAGAVAAIMTGTAIPLVITGTVQAVVSAVSQSYNTDGTPQSVAFEPKPKV